MNQETAEAQLQNIIASLNETTEIIKGLKTENMQLKAALKNKTLDVTWPQFCAEITRKNRKLGALLEAATVERFDMPRIWLRWTKATLSERSLINWQLRSFLELYTAQRFGRRFRLRLTMPDLWAGQPQA